MAMSKFRCNICGYTMEAESAPERCPQCGNSSWSETEVADWAECDPKLGQGGGDVEVIVQRNTNSASRSKNFTVRTASGLSKSVNVTQAGAGARTIDVYCLLNTVAPALTRVVGTFQESYQAPTQIIVSGGIVFTTTDSGIGELSQAFTFTINSGNSGGVVTLSELQVPDDVVLVSVNLQKSTASCNPSTYDGNTFVADWTTPPNS